MKAHLSDSGDYVIVYGEEGVEPVQYSISEFIELYNEDSIPERKEPELELSEEQIALLILEYAAEFCNLIDICGQVSYYMNMIRCIKENVAKAKNIAAAYQHNLRYYKEQYTDWREKALRSFTVLTAKGEELGYEIPERKTFLNNLVFYKDRRKCYKDYLERYLKKGETFPPKELEKKYFRMLRKRQNRK